MDRNERDEPMGLDTWSHDRDRLNHIETLKSAVSAWERDSPLGPVGWLRVYDEA